MWLFQLCCYACAIPEWFVVGIWWPHCSWPWLLHYSRCNCFIMYYNELWARKPFHYSKFAIFADLLWVRVFHLLSSLVDQCFLLCSNSIATVAWCLRVIFHWWFIPYFSCLECRLLDRLFLVYANPWLCSMLLCRQCPLKFLPAVVIIILFYA